MGVDGHIVGWSITEVITLAVFRPTPGSCTQFIYCHRDMAAEILHNRFRHAKQVPGFVVGITDALTSGKDDQSRHDSALSTVGYFSKMEGGHIYPLIGALGGKDDGYQQFIGDCIVDKFGLGFGRFLWK